ncbi:MAG: hypothetical protein AAF846_17830 [Chloroflexota bacterium]
MDITTPVIVGVLALVLIIVLFTLTKPGRKFMFSWRHKLLGEVNAEAENIRQIQNHPEQTLEESNNVSQEMVGATGGKQIAKNTQNSSQKIT